ncbi:MAG: hypothetical protein OEL83_17375 [Desulforhopalus sp.]|nr:hypothetical protein [Desulforhopalus sp.]
MAGERKKMVAALAAVNLYLQQEEEQMSAALHVPPQNPPGTEFSQWGQSGRQEMMAMRRLIQLRTFTRF